MDEQLTYDQQVERERDAVDKVLEELDLDELRTVAAAIWQSTKSHPDFATCECPAFKAIRALHEMGFKVVKA